MSTGSWASSPVFEERSSSSENLVRAGPMLLSQERMVRASGQQEQGASDASCDSSARGTSVPMRIALESIRCGEWTNGEENEDTTNGEGNEDAAKDEDRRRSVRGWLTAEVSSFERELGLEESSGDSVVVVAGLPRVSLSLVSSLRACLQEVASRATRGGAAEVFVPWDSTTTQSKPVAFLELRSAAEARLAARALNGSSLGGLAGVTLQRGASRRMCALLLADARSAASSNDDSSSDVTDSEDNAVSSAGGELSSAGGETSASECGRQHLLSGEWSATDGLEVTLASLRGPGATWLAHLERDLDRAIAEGDARRAAKLDVRLSAAYRGLMADRLGTAADRLGTETGADDDASTSASESRRPPNDVLSVVERALKARAAHLEKNRPTLRRRTLRRQLEPPGAVPLRAPKPRSSRIAIAHAALRAERLRSAALVRALKLSTSRGVTLAVEARQRRDTLNALARRLDHLSRQLAEVSDRADRAERRADRFRRRRRRLDGAHFEIPLESRRDSYVGSADGHLALFRQTSKKFSARGGAQDIPDNNNIVLYRWDQEHTSWTRLAKLLPPNLVRRRDDDDTSDQPRPEEQPNHDREDNNTLDQPLPPDVFVCPITLAIMTDPVICADGFSYERAAIQKWLAFHATSPLTNLRLHSTDLVPNRNLKLAIARYCNDDFP